MSWVCHILHRRFGHWRSFWIKGVSCEVATGADVNLLIRTCKKCGRIWM